MPAQHDFTDEELQEFAQHGVIITQGAPAATANEDPAPAADPAPAGDPAPAADPAPAGDPAPAADSAPAEQPRDPATGQFVPQAPADPNAAPADPNAPPQGQQPPAAPPPGFVPHQALHQERQQRQQMAQQLATLQARTNAILAARQQPELQLPDLQEDPVGYVRGLEERLRQFEESQAIETQNRQIESAIEVEESTFRTYTPDYDQASAYYVQSRAQELLAFYPPQQAQQIMMQEARQMATEAWQRGIPAPQMVYTMAQARGYRPGAPAGSSTAPLQPQGGAPQPQAAAPSPGTVPAVPNGAPAAAAVVAAAQQGQAATRTLSGGSGAASATNLNAEALLSMSDEEFEQYLKLGQKGANARFAAIG